MALDVEQTIRDYLPQIIHLSLATSSGSQPWVCEVHFAYDDLNLYFRSLPSTRHSQEIEANQKVAGNIVTQHLAGQKPRGVYFEGTAELLHNVGEDQAAYKLYCDRFGTDTSILDEAMNPGGTQFYKISVSKYYLFDARESHPAQKYELDWSDRN